MKFKILSNRGIASSLFLMKLEGDTSAITSPGQFVEISLPGFFLRRPISVCDVEGPVLTLIYKVVGKGTDHMSHLEPGTELDLLTGLGHGFTVTVTSGHALLAGGGVGVPPLYLLARRLLDQGKRVSVALGFNSESDMFAVREFRELGCDVAVATVDGSFGVRGFVTDAIATLPQDFDFYYSCGPLPMLKALAATLEIPGEISMEERMGCGFGACMGCSIMTASGPRRVCKDGPVFPVKEIHDLLLEK